MTDITFRWVYRKQELRCLILAPLSVSTLEEEVETIYSERNQLIAETDIVLIRVSVAVDQRNRHLQFKMTQSRFVNADVLLLVSHNFQILSYKSQSSVRFTLNNRELKEMITATREAEMQHLMQSTQALFQPRERLFYEAPSQICSRSFLRVGSIQTSIHNLEAIFFWLSPYLQNCAVLLTETWSISSTCLYAINRLRTYSPQSIDCTFEMLPYHRLLAGDVRAIDEIDRILRESYVRLPQGKNILLVLSAISTGRSLRALFERLRVLKADTKRMRVVVLYKLASNSTESLCDLSLSQWQEQFQPVTPDVRQDDEVILIDPLTYFPVHLRERSLNIDTSCTMASREIFDSYKGIGACVVHTAIHDLHGTIYDHHGLSFNLSALLNVPRFSEKLDRILSVIPDQIMITHIATANAKVFAEAVYNRLVSRGSKCHKPRPLLTAAVSERDLIADLRSASSEQCILVVEDQTPDGSSLSIISRTLRDVPFLGRCFYLVGILRLANRECKDLLERELSYRLHGERHRLIAVESLFLPHWDRHTCPWCIEQRDLSTLAAQGLDTDSRMLVTTRVAQLEGAERGSGLINNVFWKASCAPAQLSTNSIFMDATAASEADVLFCIAAAVHHLRGRDGSARLEWKYPNIAVLDDRNYLGQRFTDDILRVAIMRVAKWRELLRINFPDEETRRSNLGTLLTQSNSEMLHLESIVASLAHKLPQVHANFAGFRVPHLLGLLHATIGKSLQPPSMGMPERADLFRIREQYLNDLIPDRVDDG